MFEAGEDPTGPEDPDGEPDLAAHQCAVAAQLTGLLAVRPDPGDGPGMAAWIASMAKAQASLDGLRMAMTAAFDASGEWGLDGVRSPVSWLVDRTAVSRAAAGSGLKTARLARSMAHVSAAALAGQLCAERVRWLTRARTDEVAERFDRDEAWLVSQAVTLDVDRLRVFLLTWRLRALEEAGCNEPDGDPPTPPGEQDRINLFPGVGGRGVLDGDLTPESRAILFRAVAAEIAGWHRDGALVEDPRSQAELNADALMAIVKRGCLGGTEHGAPRPLAIALADLETIARLATQMAAAESAPEPTAEPTTEPTDDPSPAPTVMPSVPTAPMPSTTAEPEPDLEPDPAPEPAPERAAVESAGRVEPKPKPVGNHGVATSAAESVGTSPRSRKRCEVVGVGSISERSLRRLLSEADISLVVVGADGHPVAVRRSIRFRRRGSRGGPKSPAGAAEPPPSQTELIRRLVSAPLETLDFGRSRRLASSGQWRALLARSGGRCEVPGCLAPYWRCDIHHLVPWEHGGPTDLEQLVLACPFHHRQVLHNGFTLSRAAHGWQLSRPDGTPVELPFGTQPR